MRKRSSKKKPVEPEQPTTEPEAAETAPPTPDLAIGKNPAAVALGKLGGAKGGKARAAKQFGDLAVSRDAYQKLVALSTPAPSERPELLEAQAFLTN